MRPAAPRISTVDVMAGFKWVAMHALFDRDLQCTIDAIEYQSFTNE
jgi:hypothetical protein